jgi:hypothetical protein
MSVRIYLGAFLLMVGVYLGGRAAATMSVTMPLLWPLGRSLALAAAVGALIRQRRVIIRQRRGLNKDRRPGSATPARRFRRARRDDHRRVGDAERAQVTAELHDCFAGGYLDQTELEERLDEALAAKTVAELEQALRDLPFDVPPGGINA